MLSIYSKTGLRFLPIFDSAKIPFRVSSLFSFYAQNEVDKLTDSERDNLEAIYDKYSDHWKHSQTIRWTIFAGFLVTQGFFLSSITANIRELSSQDEKYTYLLIGLEIVAVVCCGVFNCILERSSEFCRFYASASEDIESLLFSSADQLCQNGQRLPKEIAGPFRGAESLRKGRGEFVKKLKSSQNSQSPKKRVGSTISATSAMKGWSTTEMTRASVWTFGILHGALIFGILFVDSSPKQAESMEMQLTIEVSEAKTERNRSESFDASNDRNSSGTNSKALPNQEKSIPPGNKFLQDIDRLRNRTYFSRTKQQ